MGRICHTPSYVPLCIRVHNHDNNTDNNNNNNDILDNHNDENNET